MEEVLVIVIPTDGRKGVVLSWSECMNRYDLTNEELRNAINNGTLIKNKFYVDESLTR